MSFLKAVKPGAFRHNTTLPWGCAVHVLFLLKFVQHYFSFVLRQRKEVNITFTQQRLLPPWLEDLFFPVMCPPASPSLLLANVLSSYKISMLTSSEGNNSIQAACSSRTHRVLPWNVFSNRSLEEIWESLIRGIYFPFFDATQSVLNPDRPMFYIVIGIFFKPLLTKGTVYYCVMFL